MSPRRLRWALLAVVALLAIASAVGQLAVLEFGFRYESVTQEFDSNVESNVPTMFSAALLAVAALLFAALGATERSKQERPYWLGLAILFVLAAFDEGASVHETANNLGRALFDTPGVLQFAVVGGVLVLGAVILLTRRFFTRLPHPVRRLALGGVAVYAGGALAVESVERLLADRVGEQGLSPTLVGTLSEFLEMAGVVLIIEALLVYILLERRSASLMVRPAEPNS